MGLRDESPGPSRSIEVRDQQTDKRPHRAEEEGALQPVADPRDQVAGRYLAHHRVLQQPLAIVGEAEVAPAKGAVEAGGGYLPVAQGKGDALTEERVGSGSVTGQEDPP